MPHSDPEKRKQYMKEYREKNKDKIKQYQNNEKVKQYRRNWRQSENGIKSRTFSNWKQCGLRDNFEEVWKIYQETNNCLICDSRFKNKKDKHMNHCHETGYFLNVLCMCCNILEHNNTYWGESLK